MNISLTFKYLVASALLFAFFSFIGRDISVLEPFTESQKIQSVSYAPFKEGETPMDLADGFTIPSERIDKDLEMLSKRFEAIRTYSTVGLEDVPKYARKHNLKVMLGAWIGGDEKQNSAEIKTLIALAKEYSDVISCVVVGNEVLLRGELSAQKLGSYIKYVKEALPDTKVTYADVWEFWLKNPSIVPLVDSVTIHILPYWEDDPISVEASLKHIADVQAEVAKNFPNKAVMIGETGWPSEGRMRGGSLPSPIAQATFIRGFLDLAQKEGYSYNLIEAYDQPWKRANEGAVGGYWGLYDANGVDKSALFGAVSEYKNHERLFLLSLLFLTFSFVMQIKYKSNSHKAILFAMIASALFSLQFNQYQIVQKDLIDHIKIGMLFLASMALYVESLHVMILGRVGNERLVNYALLGALFIFMLEAIYLSIDARYRSFWYYGEAFLVLSFLMLYKKRASSGFLAFEKLAALSILLASFIIVYSEGLENYQALIFSALALIFASHAIKESKAASLQIFYPYLAFVFVIAAILFVWKGEYFINPAQILACENDPSNINCTLRSALGVMMFYKLLGAIALAFALLYSFMQKAFLGFTALLFGVAATMFFNVNMGVLALLIVLLSLQREVHKSVDS